MVKYVVNNQRVTEYASMQEFLDDLDKIKGKKLIEVIEEQRKEEQLKYVDDYIAASINVMSKDLSLARKLQSA